MLFLRFKESGERQGAALVRGKKKKKPSKGKVKLREGSSYFLVILST